MARDNDLQLRDLAWNYFNFHATQRLTTFNFYIAISALLTAGLFTLYQDEHLHPAANISVGILLLILSVVFWMLDKRNQQLIELAEAALIEYESLCKLPKGKGGAPNIRALFTREKYISSSPERPTLLAVRLWKYRYGNCFEIIFFCFGVAGTIGFSWSIWTLHVLSRLAGY